MLKFEFRKIDKIRSEQLVSSSGTHQKKSANTFKTFRKELDTFII